MTLPVIQTTAQTVAEVNDVCTSIEAWADEHDSIADIQDAGHRLAAIDEYLARTSTEGRNRIASAQRHLEVRIGQLLGPPRPGERTDLSGATEGFELTRHERSEFRQMAAHPDIVDQVIDESDDDHPASRRKVLDRIKKDKQTRQAIHAEYQPPGFDAADNSRMLTSLGALKRLCADITDLPDETDWQRWHPHTTHEHLDLIQSAIDKLTHLHATLKEFHQS